MEPPSPQPRDEPPFSLTPAIFLPFKDFPPDDRSVLDQTERLQKIIQNLLKQQGIVRGNMMLLVEQHVQSLKTKAREELAALEDDYEDDPGNPEERKRVRTEVDAMFQRTKVPVKAGAKSEDFEVKPGASWSSNSNGMPKAASADGDVAMSGTDTISGPRTARMVREALSKDLQQVVDRAVSEMEAYDRHAQEVINHYKQALERRTGRSVPAPSILRNRNEESPIDMNAIRRMSTGMPIVGLQTTQITRSYQKMDDISRRGSNSK